MSRLIVPSFRPGSVWRKTFARCNTRKVLPAKIYRGTKLAYADFTPEQIWHTLFFTPQAKLNHVRTTFLMQSKPNIIFTGVNFAYTDFTPPPKSYVPYISEGIKKREREREKKEVKSFTESVALGGIGL